MFKKVSTFVALLVILSLMLTGVAAAADDVQGAADQYFQGGTKNIKAADLFDVLNDGDSSNDPFIIDARSAADYELGHIPGAVNIGAKAAFTPDMLATLPADQEIVVYCYTGQTSSQMTSALNMLGYQAKSMLFGFPAWAMVDGITGPGPFNAAADQHDYRISNEATVATETYDPAVPLGDTLAAAAEGYFTNGTKNIKASDLFDNLNDGDTSNDPVVIDVRRAEDYEQSHIPGAIHVDPKMALSAETLAMLPVDTPIVVGCYTGQTASQVTSALNMLGYDASNLKFGFAAWSPEGKYSFDATQSPNYRFEGTSTFVEAQPAAPAETSAETPAAAPAQLPATGGLVFNFLWLYLVLGGSMVGFGAYLRRK